MSRSLHHVLAAAALLGLGGGRPARAVDEWDEESRLKREALEAGCRREREAMRDAVLKQRQESLDRTIEESRKEAEDFDKLRAGIEPTTGQRLSRQRRRALNRQNFPFKDEAA
jgi:DNA anti-recombination protein RmuC